MAPPARNFKLRLRGFGLDQDVTNHGGGETRISWRQRIKKDHPKQYQALKKHDATTAQLRRLERRLKLDLPENAELKKEESKKHAARMKEYRAKKKQEKREEERRGTKTKTHKTRAETEKEKQFKAKDAARQRLKRANMTDKQRKEINAKRREKRRLEREALCDLAQKRQELEQIKVMEKEKMQQEAQRLMEEWSKLEQERKKLKATAAERKRLSRARSSISKNPIVYAATVSDLVAKASPRKKKLLEKSGIKSDHKWAAHVSENLAEQVASLRRSRRKKDLKLKRKLALTLRLTRKYRLQRQVCKAFRVTPKLLCGHSKQAHKRKVSPRTEETVHNFYEEHSVVLPDKKYVSKKTNKAAGFLSVTVHTLYANFCKENPDIKLGLSKFTSMRPPHIKLRSAIRYRGCLCEYCANLQLKIDAINKYAHSHHQPTIFSSTQKLSEITLCDKGDDTYNKLECMQRKCTECGVKKISEHVETVAHESPVTWRKWEKETKIVKGKSTKKMVLHTKTASITSLVKELEIEAKPFALHLFTASWQNSQYLTISRNPPDGWVIMVCDFAENYACRYQDEIQSVHWGHESTTLHPIVATYKCPKCGEAASHSLVMISQDNTHDYHAVHKFTQVGVRYLKTRLPAITRIVRFSDGASCQYKSRGPFLDVSYGSLDYGMPFQHEFFGSRHGKGPSDGESGVIKRLATDAVMAGTAVISNARDMFVFVKEHATQPKPDDEDPNKCYHFRRDAFWVDTDEIIRNRDRQTSKTVKGTRKIHSAVSVKPELIAVRSLSCFCPPCVEETDKCINSKYVKPYVQVRVVKTQSNNACPVVTQESGTDIQTSLGTKKRTSSVTPEAVPEQTSSATDESSKVTQGAAPFGHGTAPLATERPPSRVTQEESVSDEMTNAGQSTSLPAPELSFSRVTQEASVPKQTATCGHGTASIATEQDIVVGGYVAVKFGKNQAQRKGAGATIIYMAMVMDKSEDDEVVLKFMCKADGYYKFEEALFTHPTCDILCTVNPPALLNHRGGNQFVFSPEDIQKVVSASQDKIMLK